TGMPVRMIGINKDITKRKRASQERELIIDDMVQRNTALEQFAYIISHNLRAPIANIIGATDSLTEGDLDDEDRDMLTRGINESVIKLDNIVKDLNYILEVKGEKYDHIEAIQFADLVNDIKDSITDIISINNVLISYDFSAVSGISTLKPYAYSIFYNLITNSIKYRQQNVPCVIRIRSEQVGNKIILFFTDNGTGINISKHGENIFGLYKRFHTSVAGKGMGLFMVKTQVEKLGGKISVKSIENEETEFKIIFEQ
ncbi:MAG: HAMP domain-containing histidine kinase, partial [Sphingobacteriales bacterium]